MAEEKESPKDPPNETKSEAPTETPAEAKKETTPDPAENPDSGKTWDVKALLSKIVELQDQLIQAQEKNLLLAAQLREVERHLKDVEDVRSELTNQSILLADKSKENKAIQQELGRVSGFVEGKCKELEDLHHICMDMQMQLKTREAERDQLAYMLREAEAAHRNLIQQWQEYEAAVNEAKENQAGWGIFKGGKKT